MAARLGDLDQEAEESVDLGGGAAVGVAAEHAFEALDAAEFQAWGRGDGSRHLKGLRHRPAAGALALDAAFEQELDRSRRTHGLDFPLQQTNTVDGIDKTQKVELGIGIEC